MNIKGHILVNLGQLKDDIPFNRMSIQSFWIVKMVEIFQKGHRARAPH